MKKYIVTGGTSGIGLATVKLLLEEGHYVIIIGRHKSKYDAIVEELQAINKGEFEFIAGDLREISGLKLLAHQILSRHSVLHGLVNNAGIYVEQSIDTMDEETFDLVFNTNFKGTYFFTKYLRPGFIEGSSIVNVSSDAGINGNYNCTAYCGSKGALNLFTKALSLEWAYDKIRVNSVCPGDIDTPLTRSQFGEDYDTAIRATEALYPLGRIGEAIEVANVINFLLSDKAAFVTGAIWSVDGGLTSV